MERNNSTSADESLAILNPVLHVPLGRGSVAVRELAWPDALELCRRLGQRLAGFVSADGTPRFTNKSEAIGLVLDVVGQSTDDLAFVLERSTDLPPAAVRRLGSGGALKLLAAAIELTVNDELIASGKSLAGRLGAMLGPISAPPSSSSSGRVTPGPTSNA